ncbi:hypothetical protein ACQCN2_00990 [Brevibacillus ginsengisoli]|uniref:hypothetical protein n=1 Tax=Brevibacillus ginsengisoli TaxID=363854 RepID=UPI003CED8FEB
MQQEDLIKSMLSRIDNYGPAADEEIIGFTSGVLWTIKKLQKAGHFKQEVDIAQLYKEMLGKHMNFPFP